MAYRACGFVTIIDTDLGRAASHALRHEPIWEYQLVVGGTVTGEVTAPSARLRTALTIGGTGRLYQAASCRHNGGHGHRGKVTDQRVHHWSA